ncbi:MAG TPA: nitrate reductase cytochrome c-type subunit [Noviherbaspirillum sp.]|nr:nitrate reductase cytochrome c-type subunit [Noviherbaspirillum sp.]
MNKTLKFAITAIAACFTVVAFAQESAKSIRGIDVSAPDPVADVKTYGGGRPGKQTPITRTFSTQPPVIPHAVEKFDEINLEGNQCLDCHAAANAKKSNAPVIGNSHFIDREGNKHEDATNGRYNCTQCHVPQVDAPPLVDNVFKGDKLVNKAKAVPKK